MRTTRILTVYERPGCHLCDDMVVSLAEWRAELDFEIERVDVDRSPELADRYGAKVPVLVLGSVEICHYFLDPPRAPALAGRKDERPEPNTERPARADRTRRGCRLSARRRKIPPHLRHRPQRYPAAAWRRTGQVAAIEGSCTPRMVGYALAALPASGRARRAVAACPESHRDRQRAERWRWDHHPAPGARSRRRTLRCRWEGRLRRRRLGRTRHRLDRPKRVSSRAATATPLRRRGGSHRAAVMTIAPRWESPASRSISTTRSGNPGRCVNAERKLEWSAHLSRHSRHPLLLAANALCFDSRDSP